MSTILDTYMVKRKIKDADFAVRIGRHRSMVSKLRRGVIRPTLDLAHSIEEETGGEVSIRSWFATKAA